MQHMHMKQNDPDQPAQLHILIRAFSVDHHISIVAVDLASRALIRRWMAIPC